jgi:hypothetical protein
MRDLLAALVMVGFVVAVGRSSTETQSSALKSPTATPTRVPGPTAPTPTPTPSPATVAPVATIAAPQPASQQQ